jgi:spermidine/putrescine-binding protein
MRRRFLSGSSLLLVTILVTAACSSSSSSTTAGDGSSTAATPSGTLRLFSYSDGFDPGYMASFFDQYPDIDLKTASFGSNDEAVAKLQAGFQADVVNSCVDEATLEMVQKGQYAPLDVSRLEHWDEIWPSMKELPGVQVDGQVYLVPVDAGSAGIIYNADVVTTPPDSWTDLFDPQWAGRASMENISTTAIDIGALANGISDPLTMSSDQLDMVKQFLIDHRSQFRTFWSGEADVKAQFKNGEIVIASGYPDTAQSLEEDGVNVKYATAKEGQMLWTCGYGITPDAQNLDAAYALLNWYSSLTPQEYAATNWRYVTSNSGIVDVVSEKVIKESGLDAFVSSSGTEGSENLIPAVPPADREAWVAAWTEVKAA